MKTSPTEYWDSINPRTIQDVFNSPEMGLTSIRKEVGEIKLQAMMVKWMSSFLNFYSTNGTMDAIQIADTINLIIEAYPHYTMYDFKLFFKLAKLGNYGEVYGRIDGQVILSWLRKYDVHRDTVAQEQSINEAHEYNKADNKKDPKAITWNEYCRRNGIKNKKNPINNK